MWFSHSALPVASGLCPLYHYLDPMSLTHLDCGKILIFSRVISPSTLPSPSSHAFCQRLIGLEMIPFILCCNAVILLSLEVREKTRMKKCSTHALKPNLKESKGKKRNPI